MSSTRPPAVAGLFYPSDPHQLRTAVEQLVAAGAATAPVDPAAPAPKAVIAPHAGYVYSGPVAGTAYARVAPARGVVERVVLAGPAHRVAVDGVAVPGTDAFATPLGDVAVDGAARAEALAVDGVVVDDRAHAAEHSIEVHLPFLQVVLGDVPVLPMVVGWHGGPVLAAVLERLWDGAATLIVVSTDLSHYHDHRTAQRLDAVAAAHIVAGRGDALHPEAACGRAPVQGLLTAAGHHGLRVRQLDLRTSADTAGTPERVVGYGAFVLT